MLNDNKDALTPAPGSGPARNGDQPDDKKRIELSDHFNYRRLLRFTLPTMITMIITSIYGIVDGIFVSNCAGKTAFAAINLAWPVIMALGVIGTMLGVGGSALVAKTLGEGRKRLANRFFSMIVWAIIFLGLIISFLGVVFMPGIAHLLGATPALFDDCVLYGRIVIAANVFLMLQFSFQTLLITAERPKIGMMVSVGAGITNIIGDFFLVYLFDMGIVGAAIATIVSEAVGGLVPLIFFIRNKTTNLRLGRPCLYLKSFGKACANGLSEMVTNLSTSFVSIIYNLQLLRYVGEDGVAAYGCIMYVLFVFVGAMVGYAMGVSPIISYHFGAKNDDELKNLFKRSVIIMAVMGALMAAASQLLAYPLAFIYMSYDAALLALTERGLRLYSLSFLLCGFNIFGSSLFTALNNGVISAVISFMRTLVCEFAAVLLLPLVLGVDGIWLAVVAAELACLFVTAFLIFAYRKRYHYI